MADGGAGGAHLRPVVRRDLFLARPALATIAIYAFIGNWNNFIPWALSEWWLDPRGPDMGPGAKYYKYDPAGAKALLSAAGFPDGFRPDRARKRRSFVRSARS